VGREGDGNQSQLVVRRHKYVDIDKRCEDLIPDRDLLHRVFIGDSLEYQSKAMRIANPWQEEKEDARRHVEDYGKDDKDRRNAAEEADDGDIPF
jgi:hypothetical protein